MERKISEISWASLWRILFFTALVYLFFKSSQIVFGLFLAIVISSGFDFFVDILERKGLPRTLGVILVFAFFIIIIAVVIYSIIPLLIVDLNSIFSNLSNSGSGNAFIKSILNLDIANSFESIVGSLSSRIFTGDLSLFSLMSKAAGSALLALSILISAFYLSLSKNGIERFIRAVFPIDYEDIALKIYASTRKRFGLWFRTQMLLSITVGFLVWIMLLILGVNHALLLGVLAAIFEIVPYVGPLISGAVAVIAAFATSPALAIYTLVVFVLIQQIENHFLVPTFMKKGVDVHPVIVIVSLLIGADLGGILGVFIAVPAVVLIQEILEESNIKKKKMMRGSSLFG